MKEERIPLITLTGELYQPIRVHYHLFHKEEIIKAFSKLRCIRFNIERGCWEWLYDHEAGQLLFKLSLSSIPQEMRPIVLGSFFFKTQEEVLLDLHSVERAVEAVLFFDRRIARSIVQVRDVEVVNTLFDSGTGYHESLDHFFEEGVARKKNDPEELFRRPSMITSQADNGEQPKPFASYLEEIAKTPVPDIEILPSHFYQDGISSLKSRLLTRQIIAFRRWQGDIHYTFYDLMNEVLPVKD